MQKRLNAKEKASEQRAVVALSGLMFIVGYENYMQKVNYRLIPLIW